MADPTLDPMLAPFAEYAALSPRFAQTLARLQKLIDGPAKPGRKPGPPSARRRKRSRAKLPTYDAASQYATLASGVVIQIDAEDAPLLMLGGWRYHERVGVFCQTTDRSLCASKRDKGKRVFHTLPGLIFASMEKGRKFAGYINGDKRDLRRSNLRSIRSKTTCPFTDDELRTLYWERGLSLNAIAGLAHAKQPTRPKPPHETVRRCIQRAGIERGERGRRSAQSPLPLSQS